MRQKRDRVGTRKRSITFGNFNTIIFFRKIAITAFFCRRLRFLNVSLFPRLNFLRLRAKKFQNFHLNRNNSLLSQMNRLSAISNQRIACRRRRCCRRRRRRRRRRRSRLLLQLRGELQKLPLKF